MERNIRKIGLVNLLALVAAGALSLLLGRYAHSLAGQVASVFFGVGALTALVALFQMGLEEKERLEKLEFDELTREKAASSLFNAGEVEAFPARHAREQFERWVLPGFTTALVIGMGVGIYFLWDWLQGVTVVAPNEPMVALSLFGVQALILFVLGKYSANLARNDGQRLLRPASSFLVFGAYISMTVAICLGLVVGGQLRADWWLARVLVGVVGLITVEGVISLILEIYRPRVRGKQTRLVYESRLIGLMGQPEGIFSTAATALDYQFGFKVSETWFYRFLEKALAWLVLVQLGVLLFSTMVVFIGPGEQGLIERWGRPRGEHILNPGPHLKFPWPMERVYRFRTDEIQTFSVGYVPEDKAGVPQREGVVLWTVKHYKEEFNLLVASKDQLNAGAGSTNQGGVPADLLTVSIPVQYQIKDVKAYAYNYVDAGALLEKLATREVVRYLVGVDIFDIMSSGREKASQDLQQLIQAAADEAKLGVRILFVGLQDIHPPTKAAPAFELVISTGQENEARKRQAEGYASRTVSIAQADAARRVSAAESYKVQRVSAAEAQSAQFTNQVLAYKAAPQVFMQRAYLEALSRNSTNSRKYVLMATNNSQVIQFNLEDQVRYDLGEIAVPKPK